MEKIEIKKIKENIYEIPKIGKMKVAGRIFASEKLLNDIKQDNTLEQLKNTTMLPGILKYAIALPDAHQGYGFCIGGVAAFDTEEGVISPGGIGYDIDCSVRLLSTNIPVSEFEKKKKEILHSIFRAVPSGVGRGGKFNINFKELDELLKKGAKWAVEKGYGNEEDLEHLEDKGTLSPCNPDNVSQRAKKRGIGQVGTLGSGNHFLEMQKIEAIYDKEKAKEWGIDEDKMVIMVHCGSRGLGHQVASDYIQLMEEKYGWKNLPDRELINAPIKSEFGQKYLSAMNCSANFAFANKQIITHIVREQLKYFFPYAKVKVVYEVCHNIAKFEKHNINGKLKEVLVTRKGATRAFDNQPVIIPGSMGTSSYLLKGTEKSEELTFSSTAHGAGRVESRTKARRELRGEDIKKQLNERGIEVEAGSFKGLVEEAPEVYKDIAEVVRVSNELGIATLVAKFVPIAVMKG